MDICKSSVTDKNIGSSTECWDKTTVTMKSDQIAYLDEVSASIRRYSGTVICRAALIRGLVRALQLSRLDLASCSSEESLAHGLARRIGQPAPTESVPNRR